MRWFRSLAQEKMNVTNDVGPSELIQGIVSISTGIRGKSGMLMR